ncbi:MAG: glutamate--cysteine ligase [Gammaproteobacteria bacterium]
MDWNSERRLRHLLDAGSACLRSGLKGLEKESLRVTAGGRIAQSPHPRALGSALTHPQITTDYSEALIELITPPFDDTGATAAALSDIHAFVHAHLGGELLWAASMPCEIGDDAEIPIARYGSSNIGRMKHVYRVGLDHRYGRRMQAIAGVHFNYSLPESLWPALHDALGAGASRRDFISSTYFALIRNFLRLAWLVPYLFGTSPALCKSFVTGRAGRFQEFDATTLYLPHATSLRMSDIGYKNKNQAVLNVSYDSLDSYVDSLVHAIRTPYPEYEAIGVIGTHGYRQLNTNILQIENEFYSFVRPKQTTASGEKPSTALRERGVQYVEIRALDVNPFEPTGVGEDDLRFIEAFLLYCLALDSPPISAEERRIIGDNELRVALRGREPGIELQDAGRWRRLQEWAGAILEVMEPICAVLDAGLTQRPYGRALAAQREKLREPHGLPSARVLRRMRERGDAFAAFALDLSRAHRDTCRRRTLAPEPLARFQAMAAESLQAQAAIEAADTIDFESYLRAYFGADAPAA